ncbi:MAG: PAS domain S-box protein [Thermodesulfobacteriota bacterium]
MNEETRGKHPELNSAAEGPTRKVLHFPGLEGYQTIRNRDGNISPDQMEKALMDNREYLRATFEQAAVGMIYGSTEGRPVAVNDAFCNMLGYSRDALLEMTFPEFTHPEDVDADLALYRRLVNGEIPSYSLEKRYVRKDGSWFWGNLTLSCIREETGQVRLFFAVVQDITDWKRAETALQEEFRKNERHLAQFNALFCQLTEGLIVFDPGGNLIKINRAALNIWDYEDAAAIPRSYPEIRDLFEIFDLAGHPLPKAQWPFQRIINGEVLTAYDVRVTRKDIGKTWIGSYGGTRVYDRDGRVLMVIVTFRDVTDRHLAHAALRESQQQLQTLNESLEARVAERTAEVERLADQLRALTAQVSQTQEKERKYLSEVLHDHIQQLLASARFQLEAILSDPGGSHTAELAESANAVLKDAIDASRSLTVELSPTVLHHIGLSAAFDWLAERMEKKHDFMVRLRFDDQAEPAREEIRILVFECVRELLFNALTHSGAREADLTVLRTRDGGIRIIVEDQGRGFDTDQLRIQGRDAVTFGLFNIQQRLYHIGGAVEIDTAPGRGTRISLRVPSGRDPLGSEPNAAERNNAVRIQRRNTSIRVLIADDHELLREGLAGLLRFEPDITVVGEAADGAQAIAQTRLLKPDVILMDVALGDMSGIEATRAILSRNPDVKIIGISIHGDESTAAAMSRAGAAAYLTKGGPAEDLLKAVRDCVSR